MSGVWIKINDTRYRVDLLPGNRAEIIDAIANLFDVPHKPIVDVDSETGELLEESESCFA